MYLRWAIVDLKRQEFEWDDAKNRSNFNKHGIDFDAAREIFKKPVVRRQDLRKNYGEHRWIALSMFQGEVVAATYTLRGSRVRVISIRRANRYERKIYKEKI